MFLKDLKSGDEFLIDPRGYADRQCWQFGAGRLVYWQSGASHPTEEAYSDGHVRIYEVANQESRTLVKGYSPTWSPDGKWIGFDDGARYVIMNPDTNERRELFGTKDLWYGRGIGGWSPDSEFIVYKDLGGPMGGFLIWGLQCPEPYRIWVYRIRDGAADWVADSCKGPPCPVFMTKRESGGH